jgi:hypothetical protein
MESGPIILPTIDISRVRNSLDPIPSTSQDLESRCGHIFGSNNQVSEALGIPVTFLSSFSGYRAQGGGIFLSCEYVPGQTAVPGFINLEVSNHFLIDPTIQSNLVVVVVGASASLPQGASVGWVALFRDGTSFKFTSGVSRYLNSVAVRADLRSG